MRRLHRFALCQLNTTVGDLDDNTALVIEALGMAADAQCDLAVFPELTLRNITISR